MAKNTENIQLVLMSNASWREFPENTNSEFTVRPAKPLRIEPKTYEVGLVDAHYEKTWTTKGGQRLIVRKLDSSLRYHSATVTLPKNRYTNVGQIVSALNSELVETALTGTPLAENLTLSFDEEAGEVGIRLRSAGGDEKTILEVGFELKSGMAKLLGLSTKTTRKRNEDPDIEIKGSPPARVSGLWMSLYVYCDLVEEYRVGDGLSSLLRILPLRSGAGAEVYEEPRNIQWMEAAARDSDIVRVNIRRDDGRLVTFNGGKVILAVRLKHV